MNDIAERRNRILKDMIRSMIARTTLFENLWGEVLKTATYILNRVPTKITNKTLLKFGLDANLALIIYDVMDTNGLESNPNNDVVMNDVDGFVPVGDPKVGNDIHKPADNQKNSLENIVQEIIQPIPISRST
jgi:hypothetical protein